MRDIKRDDLVVGVEYYLDESGEKAHFVGRNDEEETLFFIKAEPTYYATDKEGFIVFSTSGGPFFLD